MKVINPEAVGIFGVPPGAVGPLVLGCILECLLSHLAVGWIGNVGIGAGQQTCGQGVRVVDLTIHARHVPEAETLPVRIGFVIAENVLAGALGNLQILGLS